MDRFAWALRGVSAELRTALGSAGIASSSTLAAVVACEGGAGAALDLVLGDTGGERAAYLEEFERPVATSAPDADRQRRRLVGADAATVLLHVEGPAGARRRLREPEQGVPAGAAASAGVSVRASWPQKLRRVETDDARAREKAEDEKRLKCLREAANIVLEANLPLAGIAAASVDPDVACLRVGQGRRFRTIRKRVSSWQAARSWFLVSYGVPWPQNLGQVLDYLEARAAEPCPRSVLWSLYSALAFLEKGGGVPDRFQLSREPALKAAIEEISYRLGSGAVHRRRKAPRLPLAVVLGWEASVVDESLPAYDRMYAWWQCVRTWASLRFDDHRGLIPSDMRLDEDGFRAVLTRTKTSGSDKRVEALPVHVSKGAYLHVDSWLRVGFGLWAAVSADRDFFLVLPDEGRGGVKMVEATYADSVCLTRALCAQLPAFRFRGEGVEWDTGVRLLSGDALPFWTEHSPRPTLPSWVACLASFPADWPDLLGRWGASRAEGYVRTHRSRVHRMQEAVAERFRSSRSPHELFDEGSLFADLVSFLGSKGVGPEAVREQIQKITISVGLHPTGTSDAPGIDNDTGAESDGEVVKVGAISKLAETEAGEQIAQGCFVVGISGSVRRLHQVGRCYRVPGVDYAKFVSYGRSEPSMDKYTARCKWCWKVVPPGVAAEECSSECSSSSSSSDA